MVVLDENKKKAIIVDVTIPFESDEEAFDKARDEKLRKYSPLRDWLTSRGYSVELHAFVVGSLGSWDPDNEEQNPTNRTIILSPLQKALCK